MVTSSSVPSTPARQHIAVSLSREELFVVMRLIKAKQIPGFDLDWLQFTADGTLTSETRQAIEIATNGLIARGYLTEMKPLQGIAPVTFGVPSPVIALVGACAFGSYGIALSQHTPSGTRLLYLHQLQDLGVVHSMPLFNIHQFEATDGRAGILYTLDRLLFLQRQQKESVFTDGQCFAVNMQAGRDEALSGHLTEAIRLLTKGGLSEKSSEVLAHAFYKANTSQTFGAMSIAAQTTKGQTKSDTFAFVVTDETCFILTDVGSTPASYHIQSVSADELRTRINEHISGSL